MGAGTDRPVAVRTPPRPRPRPRPRHGHRAAVRRELLRAVLLPRETNDSPRAAFLYLCAALGAVVAICLSTCLAAAVVAALIIVLFRTRPPRLAGQELSDGSNQILVPPAPQIQQQLKQPRPQARRRGQRQAVRPYRYNGSPLAAFLYLCAALGAAVLIWLCQSPPPPPTYGSLQGYRGLAAAVVAALIIVIFSRLPPRLVDQELPDPPNPILAAPAPQRRLALTGSVLDADRVAAAIGSSMADITRPVPAVSPPRADSSDSDGGGGSSSNGDEIVNCSYTPVHLLDAGGARLIVPGFIRQLHEMVRGLPGADAVELLRRAFRDAKKSDGLCYRLFDVVQNQCVICADPHVLTDISTGTLVMTTKITAKLLRLIWFELDGENWLCQEVKKECFREIVGQSVDKLLDAALSLSDERLPADYPLTTFDAFIDVMYSISDLPLSGTEFIPEEVADIPDLPLNRYDPVHNVVAHAFFKMVFDFIGILEATTADMHSSRESTIHPATILLVRFLEFFHRNMEMMQSVLGTWDCRIEFTMISSWVSKLDRDAEIMFPTKVLYAKGRRYIFVLNNVFCVYQMNPGGFLSDVELQSLCSLIDGYIRKYLEEYWDRLVRYLDGDSLKMPRRSSLDNFLEEFFSICDNQMTWKVRTELKKRLRKEIAKLILPKYENFLNALQKENPGSRWRCWSKGVWRAGSGKQIYTAARLEEVISGFFER